MVLVIVLKSVQTEGVPHQGPVLMAMVFAAYVSHTQCARTDLNKRFLPKPMTTIG